MRLTIILFILFVLGIMPGCAPAPQTADDFRRMAANSRFLAVDTFKVKRPYADVAATFQKKSDECLKDKRVVRQIYTGRRPAGQQIITYNPTVIKGKDKTELHIQVHRTNTVGGKPPAGGHYILVADATPLPGNRTQVVMTKPGTSYFAVTSNAIKEWAQGTNLGCPDLTKN